jgi:hypothetical protein
MMWPPPMGERPGGSSWASAATTPWQTDAFTQRQAQPSPRGPTQNSIRQPDRHRMPSQKPSQAVTVVTDAPPAMPSHVTHALLGV